MISPDILSDIDVIKESEVQKIILTQDKAGKKYIKRIMFQDKREIYKLLKNINHPNIPKVYYVGIDNDVVIIEEYIDGTPLSEVIESGTVKKSFVNSLFKQLLSAIEELHHFNIIHRDIKPDNIMVGENGCIWLLDYDIARVYHREVRQDTELKGTFGYAPIEQYGMLPTDFRTDIYAFGTTLKTVMDFCGVKGYLYKISEKCRRMDPEQRYKSTAHIKRAVMLHRLKLPFFAVLLLLAVAVVFALVPWDNADENISVETEAVTDNSQQPQADTLEQGDDLIRFENFLMPKNYNNYSKLENFETTAIFSGEGIWHYLPLTDDMQTAGTILMGKAHNTEVGAEVFLQNGVLNISLFDSLGNSYIKSFSFPEEMEFNVKYPENRRVNGELVCRDLDGDGVEELLVGLCDCSVTTTSAAIYQYFNCSMGWVIKYNEVNGFSLCDGVMISENSKFVFVENDLRIHLPYEAINTDDKAGFMLSGNKIIPFNV